MKNRFWVVLVAVIVVVISVVLASTVRAAGPSCVELGLVVADGVQVVEPEIPDLVDALVFLAQAGGVALVITFLMEKIPWFQSLSPENKGWVVFALSLGLPILAQLLLEFVPPEVWVVLDPYWKAIARGFLIWAGTQAAYAGYKGSKGLAALSKA